MTSPHNTNCLGLGAYLIALLVAAGFQENFRSYVFSLPLPQRWTATEQLAIQLSEPSQRANIHTIEFTITLLGCMEVCDLTSIITELRQEPITWILSSFAERWIREREEVELPSNFDEFLNVFLGMCSHIESLALLRGVVFYPQISFYGYICRSWVEVDNPLRFHEWDTNALRHLWGKANQDYQIFVETSLLSAFSNPGDSLRTYLLEKGLLHQWRNENEAYPVKILLITKITWNKNRTVRHITSKLICNTNAAAKIAGVDEKLFEKVDRKSSQSVMSSVVYECKSLSEEVKGINSRDLSDFYDAYDEQELNCRENPCFSR